MLSPLIFAAMVATATSAHPTNVGELYTTMAALPAPTLGVLSGGNFESVNYMLPLTVTAVVFTTSAELEEAVINGSVTAGLMSGLPSVSDDLAAFSSTAISPRAMFTQRGGNQAIRDAFDAAIVRALRNGAAEDAARANPPFEFVAVHTCLTSNVSRVPWPDLGGRTEPFKIASLGPYDWGNGGNCECHIDGQCPFSCSTRLLATLRPPSHSHPPSCLAALAVRQAMRCSGRHKGHSLHSICPGGRGAENCGSKYADGAFRWADYSTIYCPSRIFSASASRAVPAVDTARPPTGFWPDFEAQVAAELLAGTGLGYERVWAPSSAATMLLVANGTADATAPYWTVDAYYGDRSRQRQFETGCTTIGYDSTFFVKTQAASAAGSASDGDGVPVMIPILLGAAVILCVGFVLYLRKREVRGQPLFGSDV